MVNAGIDFERSDLPDRLRMVSILSRTGFHDLPGRLDQDLTCLLPNRPDRPDVS